MSTVYIVAAKRTPVGNFGGSLAPLSAPELAAPVLKALLEQAQLDPSAIDEVILGQVISAGAGMGPARQAAIHAGIPDSVPAYGLNMICGSGMKSIMDAASHIRAGDAQLVIAGGMESMSNIPYLVPAKIRSGNKMGDMTLVDALINDGLTDAFGQMHMGITAENIAEKYGISREVQDEFALNSQHKAEKAQLSHGFSGEIVPLEVTSRRKTTVIDKDEYPKADSKLEALAKLRPAFKKDGSVTAGNASGLNDGAAALLLASEQAVKQYGLQPIAEIVSYGQAGIDPNIMGMGPVPAIGQALTKASISLADLKLLELNEAFAAQALGVMTELSSQHQVEPNWLQERTNVNGGAIALGHPLGASGARITVSLIHQLKRQQEDLGLASLCIGGGMGTALIIKSLKKGR